MAHYFVESKTTKSNINKFLSDLFITGFTKKLSYKNTDKWMEKLLEISWDIPENKWIEYKYNFEKSISWITEQKIAKHIELYLIFDRASGFST